MFYDAADFRNGGCPGRLFKNRMSSVVGSKYLENGDLSPTSSKTWILPKMKMILEVGLFPKSQMKWLTSWFQPCNIGSREPGHAMLDF